MLYAEADVVEPAIKAKALAYGVNDTGKLVNTIKRGKVKRSADGRALSVSAQGSRTRGGITTRNSEIAFLNEYGKRNVPAKALYARRHRRKRGRGGSDCAFPR